LSAEYTSSNICSFSAVSYRVFSKAFVNLSIEFSNASSNSLERLISNMSLFICVVQAHYAT